mgnify:FL=1
MLEITKGTWVEAIFAKKKDPVEKIQYKPETNSFTSDGESDSEETANEENSAYDNEDEDEINENDDTFYSSYAPEAEIKEDEEEGFGMEEVNEL